MKSIICQGKKKLELKEVKKPTIDNGVDEVLLKVTAVGICGSDIHAYSGGNPLFQYPKTLGHELCAMIDEISQVSNTELKVGDKVAVLPYMYCGSCQSCLLGKENSCENLSVMGVHEEGGMCEYIKLNPKYLIKVPGNFSDEVTAAIEPLSISEHSIARGYVNAQDTLLIVGAGPIGLGVVMMGLARTKNVVVADVDDNRLKFCSEKLGVKTINAAKVDIKESLLEITGGKYATVIIDATGNEMSMNRNIHLLCNGGRIVFVGIHKGDIQLNDMDFHKRETTLIASRAAYRADFENVIKTIEEGEIDPNLMISHKTNINDFISVFENEWLNKDSGLIKGIVKL